MDAGQGILLDDVAELAEAWWWEYSCVWGQWRILSRGSVLEAKDKGKLGEKRKSV